MIRGLRRRPTLAIAFTFALLAAIFYLPLLSEAATFPAGDFTDHFLPFSLFQQQEWLAGRLLPLWNPYTYSGHPFLADVQAAIFYPPGNLLLGLTLPFTEPGARLYFLQVEAVLHVTLAGFFTFLLGRELTGTWGGGLISGVLFAFSGYLTGYPPLQMAILRTAIWLPLILWLLLRAFQQPRRWRWWIGAALAYAVALLAGHPQTFLHVSYVVLPWIGLLLIAAWRSSRAELAPPLAGVLGFLALAPALTAAQWLPSLEFTRHSVRASVDYEFVSGGFPLRDTWQALFPHLLTHFSPLYIGVVGLLLIVALIARRPPPVQSPAVLLPQQGALFFALLAVIALLLSYGGNAFLYPYFYRLAPGWDLFRGQERAAFLVVFALSLLAGYGSASLPAMVLKRRRIVAVLGAGGVLVAAGAVAWTLQRRGLTAVDPAAFGQIVLISLLFVFAVALLLWWPGWDQRRTLLLAGLAFANLCWANVATNLAPDGPGQVTGLSPEMAALQAAVAERSDAGLGLPGRVYNEYRIYEDYGIRLGIEDVWGSSPLRSARYAALFENFPLDRLWRLTGVEHVLTWRRELFGPSLLLAEFPQTTDTTFLHRLPAPNARAWLTHQVRIAGDGEALALLADAGFDLDTTALISPDQTDFAAGVDVEIAPAGRAVIALARPAPGSLEVSVESDHGGLLIISEVWLPGWRVENSTCALSTCAIDDTPLRVDLTLLGVMLPPGPVSFDLVYRPDSLRLGLGISLLSLALVGLFLYWRLVRG